MFYRYAQGHLKTENVSSTRKAIADLLEKYRSGGGIIAHVVHLTPEGTPVFTPGTDLVKEFEELTSKEGEKVIEKHHPSSFAGTDLDAFLKKEGKNKIVLTGYMAHVCVSTTARAGAELGYDVILAEDAIGDRDIPGAKADEVVKMVMTELGDAFGTVMKSSSIE
jgi:nicotinamidase-related amidase